MKIFLIGFMGSGKTHWGSIWAAKSGLPFFDMDNMIEKTENKTIAQIFELHGETYFRQLETKVLHTFAAQDNCIIACGGGTPCFNNNMQWMNKNGTTIYLKATAEEITARLTNEQEKRPLIKNLNGKELLSFIKTKINEREKFYVTAKIILPVAEINEESINPIRPVNNNE
jgi:shikimate kinase